MASFISFSLSLSFLCAFRLQFYFPPTFFLKKSSFISSLSPFLNNFSLYFSTLCLFLIYLFISSILQPVLRFSSLPYSSFFSLFSLFFSLPHCLLVSRMSLNYSNMYINFVSTFFGVFFFSLLLATADSSSSGPAGTGATKVARH